MEGLEMLDALEIGYAIKDARADSGLTQAQLADAAGISKRCLWSLELGQNPGVQLDKLLAVFRVLGLDLQIVDGEMRKGAPNGGAREDAPEPDPAPAKKPNKIDALSILTGGKYSIE